MCGQRGCYTLRRTATALDNILKFPSVVVALVPAELKSNWAVD